MDIPSSPGNYVIAAVLHNEKSLEFKVFGLCRLPAGAYFYCGSAHGPGGLKARVERHLRKGIKKFWHFDQLKDFIDIRQVWWQLDVLNNECGIAQFIATQEGVSIPMPGFGASDCRNGCQAHLLQHADMGSMDSIFQGLCNDYDNFQRKMVNNG